MQLTTEQQMEKVIKFWTDILKDSTELANYSKEDIFLAISKDSIVEEFPLEEDDIQRFEVSLKEALTILFQEKWNKYTPIRLRCDYRPEEALGWAAEKAKISSLYFPNKVIMSIVPDQHCYVQIGDEIVDVYGEYPFKRN